MDIWLVKLEEPLPIDDSYRPYRMGMLADALVKRGHHVTWWSGDRVHLTGEKRFGFDELVRFSPHQDFQILSSGLAYKKPLSPLRLLDQFYLARKFYRLAKKMRKPDLIVCAMPTPELALAASRLGLIFGIPVVLDARDYWPDIFDEELLGLKRFLIRPLIWVMRRNLRVAAENATSLVGITDFYRDHLVRYAGRDLNVSLDAVFPLGYDVSANQLTETEKSDSRQYWLEVLGEDFLNREKKIVYFAGRFNSTVFKALGPVVSLAKYSNFKMPGYVFVFCGSGQYEAEINAEFNGLTNVVTPGEVSPRNLAYLRSISYVALQPIENRVDYLNSLSNKFFEYISSGLPVVTSLHGVTGDIVRRKSIGFVYDTDSELLNCMEELYWNEVKRNEMSVFAKRLFERDYSSEVVYNRFAIHCEKVAGMSRR